MCRDRVAEAFQAEEIGTSLNARQSLDACLHIKVSCLERNLDSLKSKEVEALHEVAMRVKPR